MARPKAEQPKLRLVLRGSRFYARWWEDGAWKRVSTGTEDRRKAERFLAQLAAGLGTPDPPPAPSIDKILDGYLADRRSVVRGIGTLENCAKAIKRHLGDLQPEHLTKERMRFYRRRRAVEGYEVGPADARKRKPVRDGTILREIVTLRAALKWALHEKWIADLPHIVAPPQPPPRDRWLSRDEADRLLDEAKAPHVRLFMSICLFTAARPGAVLELTWDRIHFKSGLIDLGDAPGGKGRAIVPISARLLTILLEAKKVATGDRVIEHNGEPVGSVKTGTRAAAHRAKLPGVTPHTLRHTAATWMAIAGVPLDQISRLLGHTDPRITLRVYAKHSPDYLRTAIDAISG